MKNKVVTVIGLLALGVLARYAFDGLSGVRSPKSEIAAPEHQSAGGFTPDPEILAHANAVLSQRPWLVVESTDPNKSPDAPAVPATTVLRSRFEPVIEKDGDTWKITFKP